MGSKSEVLFGSGSGNTVAPAKMENLIGLLTGVLGVGQIARHKQCMHYFQSTVEGVTLILYKPPRCMADRPDPRGFRAL